MVLSVITNASPTFNLPIEAVGKNTSHKLIGIYFTARHSPKTGKSTLLAGVFTDWLQDGLGNFMIANVVRIGGDNDGEEFIQVVPVRDMVSAFSMFENRQAWLEAVQRRMKK